MGSQFSGTVKDTRSRLLIEAVSLFGRRVVEQSKRVSLEELAVEAELLAEGAKQLRQQMGHPDRQRAIIAAMDEETALALCRWIIEPGCMSRLIDGGFTR